LAECFSLSVEMWQGFPISKLVSENSPFRLLLCVQPFGSVQAALAEGVPVIAISEVFTSSKRMHLINIPVM